MSARDVIAKATDCERRYHTGGCIYDEGKPCECARLARALSAAGYAVVDREAMQNEIELLDMWVGDNADRSVSAVHRAMRNIRAMIAASEPTR